MKRGRKPTRDAKRVVIVTRFQSDELNAIKKYAEGQGKPVSTLIREITLAHLEAENVPTSIAEHDPNQLKIDTD